MGSVYGNRAEKKAEGVMLLPTSIKESKDELTLTPVFVLWSLFFKLIKNTKCPFIYCYDLCSYCI